MENSASTKSQMPEPREDQFISQADKILRKRVP